MIKDERLLKNLVDNYIQTRNNRWNLANQVLYDLCKAHPSHTDEHEIVAKMWLIGRSYSAAIERRKNAKGYKGDFYYDDVAPEMLRWGTSLDSKIQNLSVLDNTKDSCEALFECHSFLTGIFRTLTQLDKRSLASKYLHFHQPDVVFIYDSITSTNLGKLVSRDKQQADLYKNYDSEYVDFCIRIIELREHIKENYNLVLTPRELDTFLLNMDSEIEEKN